MNQANRKPPDFDWVTERANCSLRQMFEKLKLEIASDVESRNEHLSARSSVRKISIANHGTRMKVFVDDPYGEIIHKAVLVVLGREYVEIRDGETNAEVFKVGIGMNDEGDCRFLVDGQQYDSWQIRRKALEGLFFGQWFNET
jgi:hypothetical protein